MSNHTRAQSQQIQDRTHLSCCKKTNLGTISLKTWSAFNRPCYSVAWFPGTVQGVNTCHWKSDKGRNISLHLEPLSDAPAASIMPRQRQKCEKCHANAIDIFTSRFGDKRRIVQEYLSRLRELPPVAIFCEMWQSWDVCYISCNVSMVSMSARSHMSPRWRTSYCNESFASRRYHRPPWATRF